MTRPQHRWSPRCPAPPPLVRPTRADPAGAAGPTRAQARGPGWRQTSHGYYVPASVDGCLPEQRIMEQSVRAAWPGAVTGWATGRVNGAAFCDGLGPDGITPLPVPLVVGPAAAPRLDARITVSREPIEPSEVEVRHGIRCTTPLRGLFDQMRTASDVREAVVAMDMLAAADLVSVSQMRAYVATRSGWKGVGVVRRALELASEDSRSPAETRTRLIWVLDAGLPEPGVNQPVFDLDGQLLGIADLFDEEAGMFCEYDGADHRSSARHSRDVEREHRVRRAGLEYVKVTGPDLAHPARVVRRLLETRRRALWLPPSRRRWTLVPPPGWLTSPEESMTLDERRAYRTWLQEAFAS